MASETEIANLALSHLGSGKEVASLTENSNEARAARRFFETARDQVLRDFPWPFATKIMALGLEEEDPNDEWNFSYRVPSDYIFHRRILSGQRQDTEDTRVPYKVAQDDTGGLVYTDKEDAELEYTMRVTQTARFPADFTMALSLRLASFMAPRIMAGDRFKLGERAYQLYRAEITKAQASASGEEQADKPQEAEWIRGRD